MNNEEYNVLKDLLQLTEQITGHNRPIIRENGWCQCSICAARELLARPTTLGV